MARAIACSVVFVAVFSATVFAKVTENRSGHAATSAVAPPLAIPYRVGRHARPTYGPDYGYGWVGGGAPSWRGEPRRPNEGVFGRDYQGIIYLRRVWPNWWHGQRQQGSAGSYRTDGPKFVHHP
jgi:hypothetical protein